MGTQHTHAPRSQRIYKMKMEEYTIKESFCVLKGPKLENFRSEILTPAKAIWATYYDSTYLIVIRLLLMYFRRQSCSVHVQHAVNVSSSCSACAYCFFAHAQHVLNAFQRMLSMFLMLFLTHDLISMFLMLFLTHDLISMFLKS